MDLDKFIIHMRINFLKSLLIPCPNNNNNNENNNNNNNSRRIKDLNVKNYNSNF